MLKQSRGIALKETNSNKWDIGHDAETEQRDWTETELQQVYNSETEQSEWTERDQQVYMKY